jgi:hypothetical protein
MDTWVLMAVLDAIWLALALLIVGMGLAYVRAHARDRRALARAPARRYRVSGTRPSGARVLGTLMRHAARGSGFGVHEGARVHRRWALIFSGMAALWAGVPSLAPTWEPRYAWLYLPIIVVHATQWARARARGIP